MVVKFQFPRMELAAPTFQAVASRTDSSIEDEAAGAARAKFRTASAQFRAAEKARIARANSEMRQRLLNVTSRTNDGNGLLGSTPNYDWHAEALLQENYSRRLEVAAAMWYLKEQNDAYALHQQRMANMGSAIDDDTEDDATGEARATLRAEAQARREQQQVALKMRNAAYFALISKAKPTVDTKIWDDGAGSAGAMRSVVAARSRARKAEEARVLEQENIAFNERLANVRPRTDDGDGCLDDVNA